MSVKPDYKKLFNTTTTLILLMSVSLATNASCLYSALGNLEGNWIGGNYRGDPTMRINITYNEPTSQRIHVCETVRENSGWPWYGIAEYENCYFTWGCAGGGFSASNLRWMTFGPNHINSAQSVGVEVDGWLRFEVQDDDPIRFWVRRRDNNSIDFVRDIAPYGSGYTWAVLTRD